MIDADFRLRARTQPYNGNPRREIFTFNRFCQFILFCDLRQACNCQQSRELKAVNATVVLSHKMRRVLIAAAFLATAASSASAFLNTAPLMVWSGRR